MVWCGIMWCDMVCYNMVWVPVTVVSKEKHVIAHEALKPSLETSFLIKVAPL